MMMMMMMMMIIIIIINGDVNKIRNAFRLLFV